MENKRLAYTPIYDSDSHGFTARLVRISKETTTGYYYLDLNGKEFYQDKKLMFLVNISGYLNSAVDRCNAYIKDVLSTKSNVSQTPNIEFKTHPTDNRYVIYYNELRNEWYPILASFVSEENNIFKYTAMGETNTIPSKFSVKIVDDKGYGSAYAECKELIIKECGKNNCVGCKYINSSVDLKCSDCMHSSVRQDGVCCLLEKTKHSIDIRSSTKHGAICKRFQPKGCESWLGYENYLDVMRNCFCNPKCGFIKSHNISNGTFDHYFPISIQLRVKNLYYQGKLIEYIWVSLDSWVDRTFIDDEKIHASFIKLKEIKGATTNTKSLIFVSEIPYKPSAESLKERISFIHSVQYEEDESTEITIYKPTLADDIPPFDKYCELEDINGE